MTVVPEPEQSRPEPPEYLIARAQDALAGDPRTLELGLDITRRGGQVFVTGRVANEARRTAVADVVRGVLPGLAVHNHVTVVPVEQSAADEHIE
jgi:hypothetical protein